MDKSQNQNSFSQAKSAGLFQEAQKHIPGGVNSPVRAFKSVGGTPVYFAKGDGPYLWDVDDHRYIDLLASWGPLILGHRHPKVRAAVESALEIGTSFGAPTELETLLAQGIQEFFPSIELLRMVNSGTEATMSALRLARAYTGRNKIIKFEGCYHGHADSLLIKAGSGLLSLGVPTSPGIPPEYTAGTLIARYNDLESVNKLFASYGADIAAIIVEPVAGNMGVVLPKPDFLSGLRDLTQKYGSVLIFDEVITGFRVALGGAQERFGIQPDLTCLGKIIGGGLPVGAYGGRKEIMEMMAPSGPVYQAGTLSGNPLAMAVGLATLEVLREPGVYADLERKAAYLCSGLARTAKEHGFSVQVQTSDEKKPEGYSHQKIVPEKNAHKGLCLNRIGSMFCTFFTSATVEDYASATTANVENYARYFWAMLEQGVYLAPAQFEAAFVSLAHSQEDLDAIISASKYAFQIIANE